MLVVPSGYSRDLCDGVTRRELIRVGGSAMFGLSLANLLQAEEARSKGGKAAGGPGFGKAKTADELAMNDASAMAAQLKADLRASSAAAPDTDMHLLVEQFRHMRRS